MRTALICTLLVAAILAGCGDSSPSPEETVSGVVSALSRGDAKKVCAPLTAAASKRLLAVLADNPLGFPDIEARTCEEAITKLHAQLSKPIRAVLEDGEVDDAKVEGDRASVHVVGAGMTLQLLRIAGEWKITGGLFGR